MSRQVYGERIMFSINVAGTADIHMQKNSVGPYFTSYTKVNSKFRHWGG
jgi:hypothetical protein